MRNCFFAGLAVAFIAGIFLVRLWQPERQVGLHTEHLLRALEQKDWRRFDDFIAADYRDQWHNDRQRLLSRTREVFQYLRGVRIILSAPIIEIDHRSAHWRRKIDIDGQGEVAFEIKQRLAAINSPFDLEWRHMSAKPWDWKLVAVSNPELSIPEFGD